MPQVTDAERSAIRQQVAGLVNAALISRGVDDAARNAAVARVYDRIEVIPRFGGPETRVKVGNGTIPFGASALNRLVNEIAEEARIAVLGPDPAQLVADLVVFTTRADRDQVLDLIRGKARRLADGSIVVTLPCSRPRDVLNPTSGAAEIHGAAGIDALARWAASQLKSGPSAEVVAAKNANGSYRL